MKITKITHKETAPDKLALSRDVRVTCDGAEVNGITNIDIRYRVGEVVTAQINLYVIPPNVDGVETHFTMDHPFENRRIEVSKIICGDNEVICL